MKRILPLLTLVSCAAFPPSRMVTGAIGRFCIEPPVAFNCDPSLPLEDCRMVANAVDAINKAVPGLVRFGGRTWASAGSREGISQAITGRVLVGAGKQTLVPSDTGQGHELAYTRVLAHPRTGCIAVAFIRVHAPDILMDEGNRQNVITHEMLHALGLPHAYHADSLMTPNINVAWPGLTTLPDADAAALQGLYR